jgi:hypothetical protein
MGLERFTALWSKQDEGSWGTVHERAEIIYWWALRHENHRQGTQLSARDRAVLYHLDAALTRLEECESAQRMAETMGGTAALHDMRLLAIEHEVLIGGLVADMVRVSRADSPAPLREVQLQRSALDALMRRRDIDSAPHGALFEDANHALDPAGYARAVTCYHTRLRDVQDALQQLPDTFVAAGGRRLVAYLASGKNQ